MSANGSGVTPRRVIVAISGASGVAIGVRMLEVLRNESDVETHLVLSSAGALTLSQETDWTPAQVNALADVVHKNSSIGDTIASGSFPIDAMAVAPCSIKTLSAIASSYGDNLIARAADVTLKEGRPLVLLVRETPIHAGHLRLMADAAAAGAVLMPPVPAFYPRPKSVEQIVDHLARRALNRMGLRELDTAPWMGMNRAESARP